MVLEADGIFAYMIRWAHADAKRQLFYVCKDTVVGGITSARMCKDVAALPGWIMVAPGRQTGLHMP